MHLFNIILSSAQQETEDVVSDLTGFYSLETDKTNQTEGKTFQDGVNWASFCADRTLQLPVRSVGARVSS